MKISSSVIETPPNNTLAPATTVQTQKVPVARWPHPTCTQGRSHVNALKNHTLARCSIPLFPTLPLPEKSIMSNAGFHTPRIEWIRTASDFDCLQDFFQNLADEAFGKALKLPLIEWLGVGMPKWGLDALRQKRFTMKTTAIPNG